MRLTSGNPEVILRMYVDNPKDRAVTCFLAVLFEYKAKNKLSINGLAKRLQMSEGTLRQWKSKKFQPTYRSMERCARRIGKNLPDIVGDPDFLKRPESHAKRPTYDRLRSKYQEYSKVHDFIRADTVLESLVSLFFHHLHELGLPVRLVFDGTAYQVNHVIHVEVGSIELGCFNYAARLWGYDNKIQAAALRYMPGNYSQDNSILYQGAFSKGFTKNFLADCMEEKNKYAAGLKVVARPPRLDQAEIIPVEIR
jgi:hypothetical protein